MSTMIATTETLSHFAQHADEFAARVKKTGRPVVLTVDGEEELVVMDIRSYRELFEFDEDEAEMRAFLEQSLKDHAEGRTRPAIEALDELARKHGLRVES